MFEITRNALIIGGFAVHWYGVLIALGVLFAAALAARRETRLGLAKDTALNMALLCVPVGIICARIYYVIFSWEYYAANPARILDVRQGGLAVYGGVIGGALAALVYSRLKKIRFSALADLAAPSLALGQAVGRWGNFLNEEAFGRAVVNPKWQFFPVSVFIEDSGWHYAAFFYESIWCLLIVAALLTGERKRFFKRSGDIFFAYMFLYGLERTLVEGLRTDSLYLAGMRVSQLLSLALALAAAVIVSLRGRKLPAVVRVLPTFAALMLGTAVYGNYNALAAVFAFAALVFTAAVYARGDDSLKKERGEYK